MADKLTDVPDRAFQPSKFYWTPTKDVILPAIKCFERYDPRFDNHAEARSLDFWIVCLKTQIAEMQASREINDWLKVAYELTDVITVAIDALAKTYEFGVFQYKRPEERAAIVRGVILKRLEENAKKEMMARDQKWYEEKLRQLEAPRLPPHPVDKWEAKLI